MTRTNQKSDPSKGQVPSPIPMPACSPNEYNSYTSAAIQIKKGPKSIATSRPNRVLSEPYESDPIEIEPEVSPPTETESPHPTLPPHPRRQRRANSSGQKRGTHIKSQRELFFPLSEGVPENLKGDVTTVRVHRLVELTSVDYNAPEANCQLHE